jgi:hypothetical protein
LLTRHQARATSQPHTLWVRLFALASVWLMLAVTSVGAAHHHGEWLPHHSAQVAGHADASGVPGAEDDCPLCMAMHSAMPVAAPAVAWVTLLEPAAVPTAADRLPEAQWHFAMFSRPPPAQKYS